MAKVSRTLRLLVLAFYKMRKLLMTGLIVVLVWGVQGCQSIEKTGAQGQAGETLSEVQSQAGLERKRIQQVAVKAFQGISGKVKQSWLMPTVFKGLAAIIKVRVLPDGTVSAVTIHKSSGNQEFDHSAIAAVKRASPLPIPQDPKFYPYIKEFNFNFAPDG